MRHVALFSIRLLVLTSFHSIHGQGAQRLTGHGLRLATLVEVKEWEVVQVTSVVVVKAVSLGRLASFLSHLSIAVARIREITRLFLVSQLEILPKWPFQALTNLAVIIATRSTTFEVSLNSIFWHVAVLIDLAFSVDTVPHLLYCVLLSIELCSEDPIDKHALLEGCCHLVHPGCRIQVVHAQEFVSVFVLGSEHRSRIWNCH